MTLKAPELVIDNPSEPFSNDKLSRIKDAKILTQLIGTINTPFVLAIDSPWGSGKSSFIKMWSSFLENEPHNYKTIYFNAWETDFAEDPLISIIGELQSKLSSIKGRNQTKIKKGLETLGKLGEKVLKRSVPIIVKTATHGALDLGRETDDAIAELASEVITDSLKDYHSNKDSLYKFRENLESTTAYLKENSNNHPLIFFIDELDRCRPTYAVELLERVKHLFNVNNIVFILAIDKEQLSSSVKTLYGADMKAEGYLRRFIDIEYALPEPSPLIYPNYLMDAYKLEGLLESKGPVKIGQLSGHIIETFTHLSPSFEMSLRDQEKCFTLLSVYIRICVAPDLQQLIAATALAILKIMEKKLYNDYASGKNVADAILAEFVKSQSGSHFMSQNNYGFALKAFITCGLKTPNEIRKEIGALSQASENSLESGNDSTSFAVMIEALHQLRQNSELIKDTIKRLNIGETFQN